MPAPLTPCATAHATANLKEEGEMRIDTHQVTVFAQGHVDRVVKTHKAIKDAVFAGHTWDDDGAQTTNSSKPALCILLNNPPTVETYPPHGSFQTTDLPTHTSADQTITASSWKIFATPFGPIVTADVTSQQPLRAHYILTAPLAPPCTVDHLPTNEVIVWAGASNAILMTWRATDRTHAVYTLRRRGDVTAHLAWRSETNEAQARRAFLAHAWDGIALLCRLTPQNAMMSDHNEASCVLHSLRLSPSVASEEFAIPCDDAIAVRCLRRRAQDIVVLTAGTLAVHQGTSHMSMHVTLPLPGIAVGITQASNASITLEMLASSSLENKTQESISLAQLALPTDARSAATFAVLRRMSLLGFMSEAAVATVMGKIAAASSSARADGFGDDQLFDKVVVPAVLSEWFYGGNRTSMVGDKDDDMTNVSEILSTAEASDADWEVFQASAARSDALHSLFDDHTSPTRNLSATTSSMSISLSQPPPPPPSSSLFPDARARAAFANRMHAVYEGLRLDAAQWGILRNLVTNLLYPLFVSLHWTTYVERYQREWAGAVELPPATTTKPTVDEPEEGPVDAIASLARLLSGRLDASAVRSWIERGSTSTSKDGSKKDLWPPPCVAASLRKHVARHRKLAKRTAELEHALAPPSRSVDDDADYQWSWRVYRMFRGIVSPLAQDDKGTKTPSAPMAAAAALALVLAEPSSELEPRMAIARLPSGFQFAVLEALRILQSSPPRRANWVSWLRAAHVDVSPAWFARLTATIGREDLEMSPSEFESRDSDVTYDAANPSEAHDGGARSGEVLVVAGYHPWELALLTRKSGGRLYRGATNRNAVNSMGMADASHTARHSMARAVCDDDSLPSRDGADGIHDVASGLRFCFDRRVDEVRRLLCTARPQILDEMRGGGRGAGEDEDGDGGDDGGDDGGEDGAAQGASANDPSFRQQRRLWRLCARTCAAPIGRGAFVLATAGVDGSEPLQVPPLNVAGKLSRQQGATISLDIGASQIAPGTAPAQQAAAASAAATATGSAIATATAAALAGVTAPATAAAAGAPSGVTALELLKWPEFHNGVATGLRLADHVAEQSNAAAAAGGQPPAFQSALKGWVTYHRPKEPNAAHAGLLFALGLRDALGDVCGAEAYRYLQMEHDVTAAGLLLGVSASKRGTMDRDVSRWLHLHIPHNPAAAGGGGSAGAGKYPDLELASATQCAALFGLGLVCLGTGHHLVCETLLGELLRHPDAAIMGTMAGGLGSGGGGGPGAAAAAAASSGALGGGGDGSGREGRSLCAGFALGLVVLGKGNAAGGLRHLGLDQMLFAACGSPDSGRLGGAAAAVGAYGGKGVLRPGNNAAGGLYSAYSSTSGSATLMSTITAGAGAGAGGGAAGLGGAGGGLNGAGLASIASVAALGAAARRGDFDGDFGADGTHVLSHSDPADAATPMGVASDSHGAGSSASASAGGVASHAGAHPGAAFSASGLRLEMATGPSPELIPGCVVAITLAFLKTADARVLHVLRAPESHHDLTQLRPNAILLRALCRGLVDWHGVSPTLRWVHEQVPAIARGSLHACVLRDPLSTKPPPDEDFYSETGVPTHATWGSDARLDDAEIRGVDREACCAAEVASLAGNALCLGIRFAGTALPEPAAAVERVLFALLTFSQRAHASRAKLRRHAGCTARGEALASALGLPDARSLEEAVDCCCLALGAILSGTGDLRTLRLLRALRSRDHAGGAAEAAAILGQLRSSHAMGRGNSTATKGSAAVSSKLPTDYAAHTLLPTGSVLASASEARSEAPTLASPTGATMGYGSHLAVNTAIGFLFLGGGMWAFGTTDMCTASLLVALYPRLPQHSGDNRYHLQALRHMYVLASQPRGVEAKDAASGQPCMAQMEAVSVTSGKPSDDGGVTYTRTRLLAPCLLPEHLVELRVNGPRHLARTLRPSTQAAAAACFAQAPRVVVVKKAPGQCGFEEDPLGVRAASSRVLPSLGLAPAVLGWADARATVGDKMSTSPSSSHSKASDSMLADELAPFLGDDPEVSAMSRLLCGDDVFDGALPFSRMLLAARGSGGDALAGEMRHMAALHRCLLRRSVRLGVPAAILPALSLFSHAREAAEAAMSAKIGGGARADTSGGSLALGMWMLAAVRSLYSGPLAAAWQRHSQLLDDANSPLLVPLLPAEALQALWHVSFERGATPHASSASSAADSAAAALAGAFASVCRLPSTAEIAAAKRSSGGDPLQLLRTFPETEPEGLLAMLAV
ncbi:anaphase-promoting complex subunit 1 [Pycnococcus provasolii]|uniref:Anaphase-promoting complex subunit 1 n=2 Tax=Pycnococcus provasolii TaxID=41880 RepID=A0A830HMP1_9CHLO|nr:anaphase-promoting complex subunit 1 [Pycnococcus provasolii]